MKKLTREGMIALGLIGFCAIIHPSESMAFATDMARATAGHLEDTVTALLQSGAGLFR